MRPRESYREIYRGDTWRNVVHYSQTGRTWSGVEVKMKIRTDIDQPPVKSLTAETVIEDTLVKAYFVLSADDTADLAPGEYIADIEFKATDFGTRTALRYRITVTGDIA